MIETTEILTFIRVLGLAVAGASAFWGSIFLVFSRRAKEGRESALWQGIAQKLLLIFFPAFFLYAVAWAILAVTFCAFCAIGHEGIAVAETPAGFANAMLQQYPVFLALVLIATVYLGGLFFAKKLFLSHLAVFYGVSFALISAILLYPWASYEFENTRHHISAALHSWHPVFTLGSVIVVDFLFLALKFNLRPFLKQIFPLITAGIWLGLGLDFLNSSLIFREAFSPEARILFMQTLLGIIIINGVLLSGPIARAIISFQERMRRERLPSTLRSVAGISGSISITAWTSNYALDGFRSLTLPYWQLVLLYLCFVGIILLSRGMIEKFLERYAEN